MRASHRTASGKLGILLLSAALAAGFFWGLFHIFRLRLEAGDIYPPYSSLRMDPLGTKALLESLGSLGSAIVDRNYRSLERIGGGRDTTLLLLGMDESPNLPLEIQRFAGSGGRLVLTFFPRGGPDLHAHREPPSRAAKDAKTPAGIRAPREMEVSLETFGASLGMGELPKKAGAYLPVEANLDEAADLPPSIEWHSAIFFTSLDPDWRVIYRWEDRPVLIERRLGTGSIVLCSDSYFASNEALREERQAELLAWIIGSSSRVVFDETHLGVLEEPGVAALLRKYRLQGLAAAAAGLAVLLLWQSAMPLLPRSRRTARHGSAWVRGRDSGRAFVNLLRRCIPRHDLISICFAEWEKSSREKQAISPDRTKAAKAEAEACAALPPARRKIIETYNKISRILTERK